MKGKVRIGGALILGTIVILAAFHVQKISGTSQSGAAVVSKSPERSYIETQDSDGDGIKDWEEHLQDRFVAIADASSSGSWSTPDGEPYAPPTTFTGKFSEAFFQDYLQGKMDGEDYSDPTEFINTAISAIEKNTQSVTHTRAEFRTIESTPDTVTAYGNELASIIKKHSFKNENELLILDRALKANDPSILSDLKPIEEVYTKTIADMLVMNVPVTATAEHARLMNAFEGIQSDLSGMQQAFDDPLLALSHVKKYRQDATNLYESFVALRSFFDAQNILFLSTDDGAFFYLFDT